VAEIAHRYQAFVSIFETARNWKAKTA